MINVSAANNQSPRPAIQPDDANLQSGSSPTNRQATFAMIETRLLGAQPAQEAGRG